MQLPIFLVREFLIGSKYYQPRDAEVRRHVNLKGAIVATSAFGERRLEKESEIPEQPEDLRELARRARVIASTAPEPQRSQALTVAAELEARADELERVTRRS